MMGIDGFGIVVVLVVWGVPLILVSLLLYVIIRFGVKHGMRSYYADTARRSGPVAGPAGKPAP